MTILADVRMADYVTDSFGGERPPSLNSSVAHLLLSRSPAHARWNHPRLSSACVEEEEPRFDIGTAAHALLLEGEDRIAVCNFDSWRTKDSQAARIMARQAGMIPLLPDQADAVRVMVMAARRKLDAAMDLDGDLDGYTLSDFVAEQTALWQEKDAWCRCRPDWMTKDRRLVVSYKTTSNAEPDAFARHLLNMGYHVQAAFETRAIERETGNRPTYLWLVSEVEPPYACSLIGLSPAMADYGARQFRAAVAMWSECMASGAWGGYPARVVYPDPPEWAVANFNERDNAREYAREAGVEVL